MSVHSFLPALCNCAAALRWKKQKGVPCARNTVPELQWYAFVMKGGAWNRKVWEGGDYVKERCHEKSVRDFVNIRCQGIMSQDNVKRWCRSCCQDQMSEQWCWLPVVWAWLSELVVWTCCRMMIGIDSLKNCCFGSCRTSCRSICVNRESCGRFCHSPAAAKQYANALHSGKNQADRSKSMLSEWCVISWCLSVLSLQYALYSLCNIISTVIFIIRAAT